MMDRRHLPEPARTAERPRFILGFGTAKAGSTWLYDQLARRPDVCMPVKEAMVFHVLFGPQNGGGCASSGPWPTLGLEGARTPQAWRVLRATMLRDPEVCVAHYRALAASSPCCRVVGDISPSYAGMEPGAVAATADLLERGGFDVRAVLVMRDPVDRLVSHLRYRHDGGSRPGAIAPGLDDASIVEFASQPAIRRLHDYPRIVAMLQATFGSARCFVGFFEEFFTHPEQQRLGALLGFADWRPRMEQRSFESRFPFTPADDVLRAIRDRYADDYAAMGDLVGAERLAAVWPRAR